MSRLLPLTALWASLLCVGDPAVSLVLAGEMPYPPSESAYPNVVPPDWQFGTYGTAPGQLMDPLGVAVGPDGTIYVTECGNHRIQLFTREGKSRGTWGTVGSASGQLNCPQGVAVAPTGRVYVSDTRNHRVQVFAPDGRVLRTWGGYGAEPGQFNAPQGIAVGGDRVFVADTENHRVQVFDLDGRPLEQCGAHGTQLGQFTKPVGVAADPQGHFYVADSGNNRIQKFDARCRHELAWGTYGSVSGQLAEPLEVSYHQGQIFVSDLVNHRIQVFDDRGTFLYQWGRHPSKAHEGNGRLHYPGGIAVSPDGAFSVVCEPFENRCQVFLQKKVRRVRNVDDSAWWEKWPRFHYGTKAAATGTVLSRGVPKEFLGMAEPDTHLVVLFDITDGPPPHPLVKFGGFGNTPDRFNQPEGITADAQADWYISDRGNNQVKVFDLQGQFKRTLVSVGSLPGQVRSPGALEFDLTANELYVLDVGNHRVQVLDPVSGTALRLWGSEGTGPGQFNVPENLCLDEVNKTLYVVDSGNFRIQAFDAQGNFKFMWGGPGQGPQQFQFPYGIACGVDGHVYVTDAAQMRLKKFTATGEFVKEWGEYGPGPGQFYKPKGLGQDVRGNLYAIDFGNHRGQIFTPDGTFLMVFGEEELRPTTSTTTTSTASTTTTTAATAVHDIVTRFAPSQPAFKVGTTVKVSVLVTNVGNAAETVRVTLDGDINFHAAQNVTVPAGGSTTVVFDYPVPARSSVTLTAAGEISTGDVTPANNRETKTFSTSLF